MQEEFLNLHNQVIANEKERRVLLAKNAELLERIYRILGTKKKWKLYLAEIEVWYTRNKAYSLVTIYTRLTKNLGIHQDVWAQVTLTRLMDVLPVIDGDNYADWFSKALTLTIHNWRERIQEAKATMLE